MEENLLVGIVKAIAYFLLKVLEPVFLDVVSRAFFVLSMMVMLSSPGGLIPD